MSVCHIVGAGEYSDVPMEKKEGDLVVASDGGLNYLARYGVTPDIVIGDFDSLGYRPQGKNVIVLPVKKDVTDVGAALGLPDLSDCEEYRLYCCYGGRISHTFANIQNLLPLARRGKRVYLYDKTETVTILHDGTMTFENAKGTFSLFAVGSASGVTVKGATYEVNDVELKEEYPLGVSNDFSGVSTTVTVRSGTLIVTFPNNAPLPKFIR